jgi:hypothetical protein
MQVLNVVPPVLRDVGQGLEIDIDFAEALGVYLEHFESFAVACPVRKSNIKGSGLERCRSVKDLPWGPARLKFIPLPLATKPVDFLRQLLPVRRILRSEIIGSQYLIVTPYSLFGDWPTVAIREATVRGIPYVIEADGGSRSSRTRSSSLYSSVRMSTALGTQRSQSFKGKTFSTRTRRYAAALIRSTTTFQFTRVSISLRKNSRRSFCAFEAVRL